MATKNGLSFSSPRNINLRGQGVGRGSVLLFERTNTSNPVGSSFNGLYVNSSNQLVFSAQGSTTTLGGAGGTVSLDTAYGNGASITMDNGALTLNDSTAGAANTFAIAKSGIGSGNLIDLAISAANTGNAIDVDMDAGVAGVALYIDNGAGARTGSDIQVKSDSTGAHSVIDIDASGSGAVVGFDFQGSYLGSPAGQAIKITLDANDNLDTEVMQIDTNTGDRGIMFDWNFGHTDAGTTSHIWDIDLSGIIDSDVFNYATSAACTGNVLFLDLDNAVAQTALHIEGSGVRTQPFIELISDCTGSAQYIDFDITGAGSGNFIDVLVGAVTYTGNVLDIDLGATATGSQAIVLTSGIMTRTTALMEISESGTPSGATMLVTISGASTAEIFDFNVSGIHTSNVIDITYSAAATGNAVNVVMADNVAGAALNITGAGVRTDNLIEVTTSETGSVDGIMLMTASGVFTGSILTLTTSGAATTGSLVHLNLDAGVAYKALTIDHAGARTVETILVTFDGTFGSGAGGTFLNADITMTGASSSPFIDVDVTGVYTGNIFDVLIGASAATGDVFSIDLGATATASQVMVVASGAMLRSTALFQISDAGTSSGATFDINHTGVTTGIWFDLDATAATTGAIFDFATSAASTGTIFEINMTNAVGAKLATYTSAGVRTVNLLTVTDSSSGAVDIFQIDDSGTKSGHTFDVNISGVNTGNVLDIVYSAAATGHAIHTDMGSNLAGNAFLIDAAGVRTAPLIYVANTGTDGGTDDHILFINQTGLLDSNLIQLTFGTAISTGNALSITMDTNVAGMAINVSSAGTGVTAEGSAINVAHTGALVAGADVVRINSSGINSATSNVVEITASGNSAAGSYALRIDASGTGVEGLWVDAGAVTFDETLLVTGVLTATAAVVLTAGIDAKVIFAGTETIAAGGTTTALSLTKTMHYIDADAGGDTFTLANGTEGQIMVIVCASATGTATITPDTMKGGTSITFNAAGDAVTLAYVGAGWSVIGGNSYTII